MSNSPLKILLVEDNPFDQQISQQMIQLSKLDVDFVNVFDTAETALAELSRQSYDCCLFDISLPEKDGIWLLTEHQKNLAHNSTMIALTDQRDPTLVAQLMQQGSHGYIPKNELSPANIRAKILTAIDFHALQRALYEQAHRDSLTTLLNRSAFIKQLDRNLQRLTLSENEGILLFLDIDNFKDINDEHGHPVGDRLLGHFAKSLETCCRPQDIIGRLGGDEFVVFMPNTPLSEAQLIMNRLQYQLSSTISVQSAKISFSTSIGAACFPLHGRSHEELLRYADQALYQAKRGGRAQLAVYGTQ